MEIHLETDRLILRRFTPEDVDLIMDLDSDPEVTRYINGGQPPIRENAEEFVKSVIQSYPNYPGFGFFIAHQKPSLEFVGWFHYRPDRYAPGYMEIGYRLKQTAWGRGLATEGSKALLEYGFANGVYQVSGRTLVGNLGSQNVLRKLGLELVEEYQEPRAHGDDRTALLFSAHFEA